MLERLREVYRETMDQMEGELLEFGGEDDHVHLLVSAHPKTAVSALVGKLKGKSSYVLRQEFWPEIKRGFGVDHFWSPSYCVVSCGRAPLDVVKAYIEDQRKPSEKKHIDQSKRFTGARRNGDKTWIRKGAKETKSIGGIR